MNLSYVDVEELRSRHRAIAALPVESLDNDGVGEAIDYIRRDAVMEIVQTPYTVVTEAALAERAQPRCEHGKTKAHDLFSTGPNGPQQTGQCPGPVAAPQPEPNAPCELQHSVDGPRKCPQCNRPAAYGGPTGTATETRI